MSAVRQGMSNGDIAYGTMFAAGLLLDQLRAQTGWTVDEVLAGLRQDISRWGRTERHG